jgi:serine/threonine protein kinase
MAADDRIFHKYLGAGSYGVVVGPALPNSDERGETIHFPDNVTKIFFDYDSKNNAIESSERITGLLGDENGSFRVNEYEKDYTFGNLKNMVMMNHRVKNELEEKGLNNDNNLQLLRLPNLGVDFNTGLSKNLESIRNIPVITILQQFRKLFAQTTRLAENRYIHGDVRSANVLIQPKNGTITMIDFDWLMKYGKFFDEYSYDEAFGFYSNPPEFLLLNKFNFDLFDSTKDPTDLIRDINLNKYVRNTKNDFFAHNSITMPELKEKIKRALITNIQYIRSVIPYTSEDAAVVAAANSPSGNFSAMIRIKSRIIDQIINLLFPYFDNYGLASCLLKCMNLVYRYSDMTTMENYPHALKTRLTNNGVPYSDDELVRISQALIDVGKLLKRASSFTINERVLPADISAEMDAILARYQSSAPEDPLAAMANEPGAAEANNPVAFNINVPMGGGIRRRNRNTRRNRTSRRVGRTQSRILVRRRKTNRRK